MMAEGKLMTVTTKLHNFSLIHPHRCSAMLATVQASDSKCILCAPIYLQHKLLTNQRSDCIAQLSIPAYTITEKKEKSHMYVPMHGVCRWCLRCCVYAHGMTVPVVCIHTRVHGCVLGVCVGCLCVTVTAMYECICVTVCLKVHESG